MSPNVVVLGSRTFRHVPGYNTLFRHHMHPSNTTPIILDDGMDMFLFQPCYIQVTGQNQDYDRHYTAIGDANLWDQGVTTYLDSASLCLMILVVDIGASFTHNRLQFLHTYSGILDAITNDEDNWDNSIFH